MAQHWTTVQGPNGPPADNEFVLSGAGYSNGTFVVAEFRATSKGGQWWRSTDGKSWTKMNAESGHSAKIIWCVDHFADEDDCNTLVPNGQTAFGENVWIRVENNTQIRRSTNNGQSWTNASVNFDANAVAFGYVQ